MEREIMNMSPSCHLFLELSSKDVKKEPLVKPVQQWGEQHGSEWWVLCQPTPLLAMRLLCLSFNNCKMGVGTVPTSQGCHKDYMRQYI